MPLSLERDAHELTAPTAVARDKIFGRNEEVETIARTLSGKRSAVLVGPPGVGKTAIVHKLIHWLKIGRLPALADVKVYELSTVELCADTRYTGMQEDRIKELLDQVNAKVIIYVSDIWNLPGAGSYETNPRGVYELMRPGIEAQKLILLGEMTPGRWKKTTRENATFLRDFVEVRIGETDESTTREILAKAAADYGKKLTFDRTAVDRVFGLTRRFLSMQSFPGKAVDLLRRVAQAARPPTGEVKHEGAIDTAFVEEVFGQATGLPLHMISPRVKKTYDDMHAFLEERVLGQRDPVTAVADVLALYKSGLKDPERPAGVLLFVGPTGVGKTELAKATAEFLFGGPSKMFRIDCTEFKDFHAFEKLIGDPRSGKTGTLTDHVRQHPFSVILLDEFEKAHPNLADLFLQLFDEGRLTDATGDTIDFRNSLIILTSNVGSGADDGKSIGFGAKSGEDSQSREARVRKALEGAYRPEFLNRIDRVLVFQPLAREDMRRIAQRELGKLYKREGFAERDLLLEVDEGVIDLLLDRGFDPKYGARPLKRAIETTLVLPLARAVLGADMRRFQLLRVDRRGDNIAVTFEDTEHSKKLENLERRAVVESGGKVLKFSLAQVRDGLTEVRRRLLSLHEAAGIRVMQKELAELERKESLPGFWEQAFGRSGTIYKRHRLQVEVSRYQEMWQQMELLAKLVQASFDEVEDALADDLLAAYGQLIAHLDRAEIELVRFSARDQGHARLLVRTGDSKPATATWVGTLVRMYETWAKARGYETTAQLDGETQILVVEGPYAFGYLRGESGTHRVMVPTGSEDGERRGETHLITIDVIPHDEPPSSEPLAPPTPEPGPLRVYDLWQARTVRDRRTGHSEGDPKRVLDGRIDAFIDAAIRALPTRAQKT